MNQLPIIVTINIRIDQWDQNPETGLLSFFERKILLENQQKLHYLQNIYIYVHPTTSYICKHYT